MSKMGDFKSAGSGLDKFFTDTMDNDTPTPEKNAQKANKAVKKVFSFRTLAEQADDWRLWADAAGMKVDELGTAALTEYIENHPLTKDQKQIYELKKAQKKS